MAQKIVLRTNVAVAGGPTLQVNWPAEVEVVTKCAVEVPADSSAFDVSLPLDSGNDVELFVLTCNEYDAGLTYTVDGGGAVDLKVDGPHVLIGTGATGLLGTAPTKLTFTNNTDNPVKIDILVGRQATG